MSNAPSMKMRTSFLFRPLAAAADCMSCALAFSKASSRFCTCCWAATSSSASMFLVRTCRLPNSRKYVTRVPIVATRLSTISSSVRRERSGTPARPRTALMLSTASETGCERDRYSRKESEETTMKQRGLPKTETLSGRALPVGSAAAAHASAAVGGGASDDGDCSTAAPRAETPAARRTIVTSISRKVPMYFRHHISPILQSACTTT
mmetsp:Transcript_16236/g.38750  ORF Transcript_16236/g.38750 Transcript_16236/m.38750 type:complete len:208 (-) Transcript_16236:31-654(-)